MKINEAQAQKLETYGFKWAHEDEYGVLSTDRVDSDRIERIVPSGDGFVLVYDDLSRLSCSCCVVERIQWRDNPSKEWIYVFWSDLKDLSRMEIKMKNKINIVVKGGVVESVYTNARPTEVEIEVIDLDILDENESGSLQEKKARINLMDDDPTWEIIW